MTKMPHKESHRDIEYIALQEMLREKFEKLVQEKAELKNRLEKMQEENYALESQLEEIKEGKK